jgi:phosphate transport system protein
MDAVSMPAPPTSKRGTSAIIEQIAHAITIAYDAVRNLRDLFATSSQMALLAVRDCERELDRLEREIDDSIPTAIARTGETRARELIACLRFVTDLERIGDLLLWVGEKSSATRLDPSDSERIERMLLIIENMLVDIRDGLLSRDIEKGYSVLRADPELDTLRTAIFQDHLQRRRRATKTESVDTLFIVQAVERAGDHATNLAEELVHLIEGHSIRHVKRRVLDA